jgi:hypothetical protein
MGHNPRMRNPDRRTAWIIAVIFGVAVAIGGVYFFIGGLDKADKLGSVIGSLAAIIGLGLSTYSVLQVRNNAKLRVRARSIRQNQASGNSSTNIQAAGDLTIGDNNKFEKE